MQAGGSQPVAADSPAEAHHGSPGATSSTAKLLLALSLQACPAQERAVDCLSALQEFGGILHFSQVQTSTSGVQQHLLVGRGHVCCDS
jgi:hypothetical protein